MLQTDVGLNPQERGEVVGFTVPSPAGTHVLSRRGAALPSLSGRRQVKNALPNAPSIWVTELSPISGSWFLADDWRFRAERLTCNRGIHASGVLEGFIRGYFRSLASGG